MQGRKKSLHGFCKPLPRVHQFRTLISRGREVGGRRMRKGMIEEREGEREESEERRRRKRGRTRGGKRGERRQRRGGKREGGRNIS